MSSIVCISSGVDTLHHGEPPSLQNPATEGVHGAAMATCDYLEAVQDGINVARTECVGPEI